MEKRRDVALFYEQLDRLIDNVGLQTLVELNWRKNCPEQGVYFFFEAGEYCLGTAKKRVVRVGTHGLKAGAKTTLMGRLLQHRGNQGGGGNHRGSVFRLHLGKAICKREQIELPSWGVGNTATAATRQLEYEMEERVNRYIREMPFVYLRVADREMRKYVERNSIALLAGADGRSENWLGLQSGKASIIESGLWNVQHVNDPYEEQFIEKFTLLVKEMATEK